MRLNRTKVLVISLVVITLALGGAALYIANRLQNQIQTPSSAATVTYNFTGLPTASCPSAILRLQPDSATALSQTLTRTTGQSFKVVIANSGTSQTETTGIIRVQKPDGTVETVGANGAWDSAGYGFVGDYTFVGTLGSTCVTNYATLTLTVASAYKCKVIFYKDTAFTKPYSNGDTVVGGQNLYLGISRTATGARSDIDINVRNEGLRKGNVRIPVTTKVARSTYEATVDGNLMQAGDNVFEFGYTTSTDLSNLTQGDWCEPLTLKVASKPAPGAAADPVCVDMKIGKSASSLTKLNTREQALLLTSNDTLTVTYTLTNVPVGEKRTLLMYNAQNIGTEGNNSANPFLSYNSDSNAKQNATAVVSGNNVSFTYTLTYADLFKADTTTRSFVASPAETPQWNTGEVPNLVKLNGIVKPGTGGAANTYSLDCISYVKKVNIVAAATSSPNAICKDLLIGTSLSNQAKKNTREAPLSVSAGSDIYITHTLSGLDTNDRTRYLRIYNGQNKSKDDGSDNQNYVSYNSNDNAYQRSTGTGTTDIKFTYKLTYAQLFQADSATLGFAQSPAETPQWVSGQVPNYVKLAVPVKPFVTATNGSYDQNCIAYVKRADATVTLVNTSNAVCVGMTIGKNGGTQSARKTRDNPLLVSSGDTINITHTLSGLSSTENSRTLRMYNAQNISTTGDNSLNSFTSYNDLAATYQTTQRVANGSNYDFKYTLTYDQLFKADTTALVKAATPAEKPQWASGGIPNLVKVAVPVKPFGTNLLGTYSADCLGYISRVGITLASASGGSSGGSSGSGTSGNGSNDDLPSTDLSAFDIFKLIGGAIFLIGGLTIMKYRSRFENI